jgi:hypothetical protein
MRKAWMSRFVGGMIAVFVAAAAFAEATARAQPVEDEERSAVLLRVADLVEARFFDQQRAQLAAVTMRRELAAGAYDQLRDPAAFAAAITTQYRAILNDQHFRLEFAPPLPAPPRGVTPSGDPSAALREAYRVRNFDFLQTAILDGNVGYLRIFTFAPASLGEETAVAALRFLAHTDALIIDLRGNRGGHPDMGLFVASYLFDQPVHYATRYRRQGDRYEQEWTRADVPGPRLTRQPVYILISRDTFSGGESLAYSLQALGRATVVGERTQGGAAGANTLSAGARFQVSVSDVNFTSPATNANWEGVGVEPDIPTTRREALTAAHLAALAQLGESAVDEERRTAYAWGKDVVRARAHPPVSNPRWLAALAGQYGERLFIWESGELLYRRGENAIYTLIPLGNDEFMLDGSITARFRFARRRRDWELTASFSDGSEETAIRAP